MPTCASDSCREVEVFLVPEGLEEKITVPLTELRIPETIPEEVRQKLEAMEPKIVDDFTFVSQVKICHATGDS